MAVEDIKPIIEALVFVSSEPLSARDLQKALDDYPPEEVEAALESLRQDFESGKRGLVLGQAAGGYQLLTAPEMDPWIRKMLRTKSQERLTLAALETLAIIAYKQPITLPEILVLRRVNSTGVIKTLLDKNLIRIVGRKKVVGNPILYGTSKEFLQRFGLNSLKDLPSLEEFQSLAEQSGIELSEEIGSAPGEEAGVEAAQDVERAPEQLQIDMTTDENERAGATEEPSGKPPTEEAASPEGDPEEIQVG